MYLLGAHLPDDKLVRIALTSFYGISHATAKRLCARLQIHDRYCVHELNDNQVNQISAYLSSPGSIPARAPSPTSPILVQPSGSSSSSSSSMSAFHTPSSTLKTPSQDPSTSKDPLRSMMIESDLKRHIAANINHHRQIGTYIGRRHLQGLPVRGQRTRTNALTAKKLNRGGRGIHTSATSGANPSPRSSILSQITSLGEKFR